MPALVKRNTTIARVSFFTFSGGTDNRIDAYDEFADTRAQSSLLSFIWEKRLGEPFGHITISLKGHKAAGLRAGEAWPNLIEEGDWWMADDIKNGVNQGIAFGKITNVGIDIQAGQGEGAVIVTVTGDGIGFALADTPIYFNPYDPELDNRLGIQMMRIIDRVKGKADQVVINAIRGFMGGLSRSVVAGGGAAGATTGTASRVEAIVGGYLRVPFGLGGQKDPEGEHWVDFVDFESCVQTNLRGSVFTPAMFTPEGAPSVWEFIDAWRNPVMNELFIDSVGQPGTPKRACLTLREKPFVNGTDGDESSWFKLRTWKIEASMIRAVNVSRGANRKNYVSLMGDLLPGLNEDSLGIYIPVADRESIDRYGLKRLEERTRYFDDVGNAGAQTETKDWLFLIVSWNVLNHRYFSGTIDLAEMRAEIRVGTKIVITNGPPAQFEAFPADTGIEWKSLTFYVEGVRHTYLAGAQPTAMTQLIVSRGFVEGERVSEIIAAVDKYEGLERIGTGGRNSDRMLDPLTDIEADALEVTDAFDFAVESNEGVT